LGTFFSSGAVEKWQWQSHVRFLYICFFAKQAATVARCNIYPVLRFQQMSRQIARANEITTNNLFLSELQPFLS
jgi:hypothetical protein